MTRAGGGGCASPSCNTPVHSVSHISRSRTLGLRAGVIFTRGTPLNLLDCEIELRYSVSNRDCSRATGFIQLVHDEVRQGFVDGLRLELHATYPAQDAH